jgi:hypothetical protein
MESRWLAFDRLVRDLGALEALDESCGLADRFLVAQARLATREAALAVQHAAQFTNADFDEHLFAQAAAAVTRAQRAAAAAHLPVQGIGRGPAAFPNAS